MKTYAEKLKDPRWQKMRLEILQRDDFTCRDCGDKESTLHVHHCLYLTGKNPWEYMDSELRTLCMSCHETRHNIENDAVLEFKRMIADLDQGEIFNLMMQCLDIQACGLKPVIINKEDLK